MVQKKIKYARIVLFGLLSLLIVVLLTLQTSWGITHTAQWVLNRLDLFEGASLTIERIEGNLFRHLRLQNIHLVHDDGHELASIDEIEAAYRLGLLLRRELKLEDVRIQNPRISMIQHPDARWDLLRLFPRDTLAVEDAPENGWKIAIDRLHLEAGSGLAKAYAAERDSTYRITDLELQLTKLSTRDPFEIDVQHLAGQVWLPGASEPVDALLKAAMVRGDVRVDTVSLQSAASDVHGTGRFSVPIVDSTFQDTHFDLSAAPLAFDDIRLFAPALLPGQTVDLNVRLTGAEAAIDAAAIAQFADSATVKATGRFERDTTGAHRYTLDSEIRRLALQRILTTLPDGLIQADIDLDVTGQRLDSLDGTIRAMLFGTRLAGHDIDTTTFAAVFRDGQATTVFKTGLGDAALTMTGVAQPFKETPSYWLSGEVQGFDTRLIDDASFATDLNAAFTIEGRGINLEDANLTTRIMMAPSRLNRFAFPEGRIDATLEQDRLRFEAELDTTAHLFQANGRLRLGKPFELETFTSTFNQFDIAAILGDTTRSSLNGSIEAALRWPDAKRATGSIALSLAHSSYRSYQIASTELQGSLAGGTMTVQGAAETTAGTLDVAAWLEPFSEFRPYEITRGRFSGLNIGAFTPDTTQHSNLNGAFSLNGSGFDLATLDARGELEIIASTLNRQIIDQATVAFTLSGDTLTADMDINLPEGSGVLTGRLVHPAADAPRYALTSGRFEGIDVGRIIGNPDLHTDLNGMVTLDGAGFDPREMEISGSLTLRPSAINEAQIRDAFANIDLGGGIAHLDSDIWLDEGSIRVQAEAESLNATPAYRLRGDVRGVNLSALLGQDSSRSMLNFSFDGEGRDLDLRTMTMRGTISGRGSNYQAVRVDTVDMAFEVDRGLLTVDTLYVASNIAALTGSGLVALYDDFGEQASDFNFDANLLDISLLKPYIGAEALDVQQGQLNARIFGRPGTLRFDARTLFDGFIYNNIHTGNLNGRLTGELNQDRTLALGEFIGDLHVVSIPGLLIEDISIESSYASQTVSFSADARIDSDRDARLTGRYYMQADSQRVELDEISLKLDADRWLLDQQAIIEIGQGFRVRRFLMASANQQFAIDGIVDLYGAQNLLLTIENFRTGTIADLFGFEDLGGTLNGYFDLRGPASAPILEGAASMNVIAFGQEAGDLSVAVQYDSLRFNIDATMAHVQNKSITATGYLPMNLAFGRSETQAQREPSPLIPNEGEVALFIQTDSLAIDWLLPFFDQTVIDRLGGRATADIQIEGTAGAPVLSGTGRIFGGQLRLPVTGVTYDQINANLTLQDNLIRLQSARVRTSEGHLDAAGTIELNNLTTANLDIDITTDHFTPVSTREYRATASGNLKLTGALKAPVLRGNAVLQSADLFLDEAAASGDADINVKLSQADLLMLEREFGIRASTSDTTTFNLYQALTMEIDLVFERDVWVRSKKNPEMNVQFTGRVDLSKEPNEDPTIFGALEVNPERSYITQFGKRFDITLGNLTFNGPPTDPLMDIEARYDVPARRSQENAVTINLDVEGRMAELELRLSSDPTMELTDIVSYIVTGRPASEALQLGGVASRTGTSFAVNQGVGLISGAIEGLVQDSRLELDVIQIEPRADARGATITAGKYVTPRIFTSVSQPIGATDTDGSGQDQGTVITLEVELVNSLILRLLGGESVMKINLLWQHAY